MWWIQFGADGKRVDAFGAEAFASTCAQLVRLGWEFSRPVAGHVDASHDRLGVQRFEAHAVAA